MFRDGIYTAKSFTILMIDGREIKGDFAKLDGNKEVESLGYTLKWKLGSNAKTVYKFKNGNWNVSWNKGVSFDDAGIAEKFTITGSKLVLFNKFGEEKVSFLVKGDTIEHRKAEGSTVFLTVFGKDPYADLKLRRYEQSDEAALFDLIKSEGDAWDDYAGSVEKQAQYKNAVQNSITYVCCDGKAIAGFVRVKNDDGFGIYILDLLVNKAYRGNSYGKFLIEKICIDFPDSPVYALSDVDGYYEKLKYKKQGTIYTVK